MFCSVSFTYSLIFLLQYDEAREYVERARKCLATELAALVKLTLTRIIKGKTCTFIVWSYFLLEVKLIFCFKLILGCYFS